MYNSQTLDKIVDAFINLYELLPDWEDAEHRRFTVLLSREAWIEYNPAIKTLKIKIKHCKNCGECCSSLGPNSMDTPFGVDDEGKCNARNERCGADYDMPYRCLVVADSNNCPNYDEIVREVKIG